MTQKIALITGASRGFGAALAEELAALNWHVVAVARTTGALEELDDRIQARGGNATLAPMDVCNIEAMRHLCRSIYDRWGKVDLWAHTAIHVPPMSPADHLDAKDWDKTVATGVTVPGQLIPFVSPLLRASGAGVAVHVDDPNTGKFLGAYAAAKSAQRTLFASWAAENETIADLDVRTFTPAPMATATRARFYPGEDRAPLAHPMDEAKRLISTL